MEKSHLEKEILDHYTIMVVDDDEALQFYMLKILEDRYKVVQAMDARETIAYLEKNEADLILLDLMLPDISGISLCRQIKERFKERRLPVVILTARTDLETKVEALEAGADDYVTKPFHPQELLTRIRVQLRIRDLQRELIQTERLKAIVETAISANHEINNPLCAIINNAELLMNRPAVRDDKEAKAFLDHILGNAQRIEKTIEKMTGIIQPSVSEYLPGISMLDISNSKSHNPD